MNVNPEKEKAILHECLVKGNTQVLVREYGGLICNTVRKTLLFAGVVFMQEDIEDLQADVYIRIFDNDCRRLRQFNPDKLSLAGWIKLIANQTTINEIRKKDPHAIAKRSEKVLLEDFLVTMDSDNGKHFETLEKMRAVKAAMAEMKPRDRDVIRLFFFQQLSLKEVAKTIGKNAKATQAVKNRARKRLKAIVEKNMR